jgi:glycosidase
MIKQLFIALFFIATTFLVPKSFSINKIEPPNWWTGMKWNKVQLMIYGSSLNNISASFSDSRIKVKKVYTTDNPNYAFIDISIARGLPSGNYILTLKKNKEILKYNYQIFQRESGVRHQGFSNNDIIYLLMPDRFANGDMANDSIAGYSDSMQRIKNQGRFGGDIKGMIDKLDYLKEFGITAVWATPLVENNTFRSYHGYSATDFYTIDPRLGSNQLFKKYVDEAHKRGIKIILDHVANHFSNNHTWMKDLPTKDWINGTVENHLTANHHKMIFTDVHADSSTIKHVERGWFVKDMVDINQENKFVQNYIIQNTIWWLEYTGLDGIREDTHPYNNQKFIARWAKTILDEYPTINIVGEVWTGESDFLAAYQKNTFLKQGFNTHLPSLTDFGLRDALINLVSGRGNLYEVFKVIAKDFLFTDPNQLVTFVDNHDLARIMFYSKGNIEKANLVYFIMMTTRGIPSIFYGSEIGMIGEEGHGELRAPFPGGFPNDSRDAFTSLGRTEYENNFYNFLKKLIELRKNHPALSNGWLIHYPPESNNYFYFRISDKEKIFVVANNNEKEFELDLSMIKHQFNGYDSLTNLITNEVIQIGDHPKLKLPPVSGSIFKLN